MTDKKPDLPAGNTLINNRGLSFESHHHPITEEERLRLLESVVVHANDAVIITVAEPIHQPGPQIVYVNDAFTRITGYTAEEVIGKTPRILQGPQTNRATLDQIRSALESWQSICVELINYHKDGSEVWVELSIVPVTNDQGWYTHWISVQRDVTERKVTEQAFIRQAQILEQIQDSLITTDLEGYITSWNRGAERLFQYQEAEILNQHISILYAVNPQNSYQQLLPELLNTGQKQEIEMIMQRKYGDDFFAYTSHSLLRDKQGNVTGVIHYSIDITERKQAEVQVIEALKREKELNELKSSFVSMVSHEFRTPLASILSSTEILEHYGQQSTTTQKRMLFEKIHIATQRMTAFLNDVLMLNKTDSGKLVYSPQPLNLLIFCQELVEEIEFQDKGQHSIFFQSTGQCSQACVDEKALRHILTNLLTNALKYSSPGTAVHFQLNCQPTVVRIQVQDQGIGIPQDTIQHLFEPFLRATNVGSIPGTGLGLAIVKRMVDLCAGSIDVETRVGQGTTFTITLPTN